MLRITLPPIDEATNKSLNEICERAHLAMVAFKEKVDSEAEKHIANFYKENPEYKGRSLESLGLQCVVSTSGYEDYMPTSFTLQIVPL